MCVKVITNYLVSKKTGFSILKIIYFNIIETLGNWNFQLLPYKMKCVEVKTKEICRKRSGCKPYLLAVELVMLREI